MGNKDNSNSNRNRIRQHGEFFIITNRGVTEVPAGGATLAAGAAGAEGFGAGEDGFFSSEGNNNRRCQDHDQDCHVVSRDTRED